MCGIYFCLCRCSSKAPEPNCLLQRRGPDVCNIIRGTLLPGLDYVASGAVLWMQGKQPFRQPVVSARGDLFLWNGNVFDGHQIGDDECDTAHLAHTLFAAESPAAVLSAMARVRGPFAFVLWQRRQQRLWFGRDPLGRRSLLCSALGSTLPLVLTSVGDSSGDAAWSLRLSELPCVGVFSVQLSRAAVVSAGALLVHRWHHVQPSLAVAAVAETLLPAGELGADNVLLAAPPVLPSVDLHVNCSVPDQPNQMSSAFSLCAAGDNLQRLATVPLFRRLVWRFEHALLAAVRRRVTHAPPVCRRCVGGGAAWCQHARLAVLFSGGVDSALLAAAVHWCVAAGTTVDLLNVAFATRSTAAAAAPDRRAGLSCWRRLRQLFPETQWNFVQIDVSEEELERCHSEHISSLIYPRDSLIDNSIGCALWFAARGRGVLADTNQPYTSEARVVLVGMGADEQLAGYGRHRTAFSRGGWPALVREIQQQLEQIAHRNLGRDDRVVSDHGREARYPYLDEEVVSFLSATPVWLKAHLTGVTKHRRPGTQSYCLDKLPIRLLALHYGLVDAAQLNKQAIQFGSRIAKMTRHTQASECATQPRHKAGENVA